VQLATEDLFAMAHRQHHGNWLAGASINGGVGYIESNTLSWMRQQLALHVVLAAFALSLALRYIKMRA
jgi:hypothetical protein